MPDFLDFLPLSSETVDTIRARVDSDANAGIDPSDDAFLDTTEGGFWHDITQAVVLEMERLWDFASTDVPAAAFPAFAWGEYLDEHGETLGVPRKDAVAATGEVTFSGTNGTLIAIGTQVGVVQTDPEEEPATFVTTDSGTVSGGTLTLAVEAEEVGTAGNVAVGAITELISPLTGISPIINAEATGGGADVETDEAYRDRLLLELSAAQGAGSVADYERWALAEPGVGHVSVKPLWRGAGTVRVIVTDADNNPVSATVEDSLQDRLDPPSFTTQLNGAVTLPDATITVDSTAGARDSGRIFVNDQLVTYTGKTATTFTGCTGGTGLQADDSPVVQSEEGRGLAPVGAIVTVDTPDSLTVNVTADVMLFDGFTVDPITNPGLIDASGDIEDALRDLLDNLGPGVDVRLNRAESRFFRSRGVYDVQNLELNGSAADLSVADLEVATLGTITLTEIARPPGE